MSPYRKAANPVAEQVYVPNRLKRAITFLGSEEVTFVMFLICASSMAAMDGYVGRLEGRRMHTYRPHDNCHMVFDRAGVGRPVCF